MNACGHPQYTYCDCYRGFFPPRPDCSSCCVLCSKPRHSQADIDRARKNKLACTHSREMCRCGFSPQGDCYCYMCRAPLHSAESVRLQREREDDRQM